MNPYSGLSPEELFRACAQTGEAAAWEEFVRRFHRLIAMVALRTARGCGGGTPEIVDELVQDTYLKLCEQDGRLLRTFDARHEGAVFGFLKVVTRNLVMDYFRKENTEKRKAGTEAGSLDAEQEKAHHGPTPGDAGATERQVLLREIDVHLRAVVEGPNAARDRRIFWLHYRAGLTANAIAAMPEIGLTTKGVESTLLRMTRELRWRIGGQASRGLGNEGIQPLESF
ncbi:MAG TPA: sigma-70 family RNA polymerase sigma factor [Candidatus Acidoferrales bacterium]|nr:sigma-70 family RNA polymerase sigma factor [Candidatus Acidoferrales bacterium]